MEYNSLDKIYLQKHIRLIKIANKILPSHVENIAKKLLLPMPKISEINLNQKIPLNLYQLINDGNSFKEILTVFEKNYFLTPCPELTAQIIEIAILNGEIQKAKEIIKIYSKETYYYFLKDNIRDFFLRNIYFSSEWDYFLEIIITNHKNQVITNFEACKVLLVTLKKNDFIFAKEWLLLYRDKIFFYLIDLENISFDYLDLLKLFLNLKDKDSINILLELLKKEPLAYDQALKFIVTNEDSNNFTELKQFCDSMELSNDLTEKFFWFETYLDALKTENIPEDPFIKPSYVANKLKPYCIKDLWALKKFTNIVFKSIQSGFYELCSVYDEEILNLYPANLDIVFWQPWIENEIGFLDYKAVGFFHLYLNSKIEQSNYIFISAEILWSNNKNLLENMLRWAQLRGDQFILQEDQKIIAKKIFKALDFNNITCDIIHNLISLKKQIPKIFMEEYLKIAAENKDYELLCKLIFNFHTDSRFTNNTLNEYLKYSLLSQNYDLYWRINSVLISRNALKIESSSGYLTSGENRKKYPISKLNPENIKPCFLFMSELEEKCIKLYLKIAPLIYSIQKDKKDDLFLVKKNALNILTVLMDQGIFSSFQDCFFVEDKAQLNQISNLSNWAQIFSGMEIIFGLHIFRFQSKKLEEIFLNADTKQFKEFSISKEIVFNFIEKLKTISFDRFDFILKLFIIRLSVIICADHLNALKTVQVFKNSQKLLEGLENFILSDEYSYLRKKMYMNSEIIPPAMSFDSI